jgi:hypothetical protein
MRVKSKKKYILDPASMPCPIFIKYSRLSFDFFQNLQVRRARTKNLRAQFDKTIIFFKIKMEIVRDVNEAVLKS